jgi:hypothetical protein
MASKSRHIFMTGFVTRFMTGFMTRFVTGFVTRFVTRFVTGFVTRFCLLHMSLKNDTISPITNRHDCHAAFRGGEGYGQYLEGHDG